MGRSIDAHEKLLAAAPGLIWTSSTASWSAAPTRTSAPSSPPKIRAKTKEMTELTYRQRIAGNTAIHVFPLCLFLVFLVLAARYESLTLPLAILLIVPMCLLCAMVSVMLKGTDDNIFTQIGLIVLVGLACKNAILIVEFAKDELNKGRGLVDAALEGARLRLRPILMTSFAFILGCVPLWTASGSGAVARRILGTVVIVGMLAATLIAIFVIPVLFVVVERLAGHKDAPSEESVESEGGA